MNSDHQRSFATLVWKVLIISSFTLFLCANVSAQITASGAISGTVKDKNQAAIANATVNREIPDMKNMVYSHVHRYACVFHHFAPQHEPFSY